VHQPGGMPQYQCGDAGAGVGCSHGQRALGPRRLRSAPDRREQGEAPGIRDRVVVLRAVRINRVSHFGGWPCYRLLAI
jgi:hypothetical protein